MKYLVLVSVIFLLSDVRTETTPVYGGLQILTKVFRQYLKSQPDDVKLGDGVHIVSVKSENDARASVDDGTVLGVIEHYLENHELRIRLPELMPGEGFGRAFKTAMEEVDAKDESTGRGKGGKGGGGMGGVMIIGLMMGKLLAALGIGGVGLLAMKALMVSALALMLSVIIGLKKLVHSDHEEHGHTVIHAGGHGHEYRRKREAADMAYHAWNKFKTT
uniref:Uncharacterized protein LOC114336180 n=1 Tax=Diabrotica virgifera virgifera TaxID=50390 RepID=A0A6P7GDT6_DIAVI